jgi:hypothetical protein
MTAFTPRSPNDGAYLLFCTTLANIATRVLSEQQQDQEQKKGEAARTTTGQPPATTSNDAQESVDGPSTIPAST